MVIEPNPALELFTAVSWGDRNHQIPLALRDFPLFAEVASDQMRKVRAPVRIRLDAWGGLHALANAESNVSNDKLISIQHFDANGKILGKTVLSPSVTHMDIVQIVDFTIDLEGNCFLLEKVRSQQSNKTHNRLRKMNREGQLSWSRTGPILEDILDPPHLTGTFRRLVTDKHSHLYLSAIGAIASVNPDNGEIAPIFLSKLVSEKVFISEKGIIFYVFYSPDANRRGIGFFNPADKELSCTIGGEELYGWLLYPLGVDGLSNTYAWKNSSIARISLDQRIESIPLFDNVVVRSNDGTIFTSKLCLNGHQELVLRVTRNSPNATSSHSDLHLPEDLNSQRHRNWSLVHVDEQERYFVFGGEEPGNPGTFLIHSSNGDLLERRSPPPDLIPLESRLESHTFWEVDSQGRIYLPITDPEGLKLVRLNLS